MGDEMLTKRDATEFEELSPEQDRELLEREALRLLNLSAEEFARRWKAGEYRDSDDPKATQVAMLLPDAW
jgi:hypothetical protein